MMVIVEVKREYNDLSLGTIKHPGDLIKVDKARADQLAAAEVAEVIAELLEKEKSKK